ncbi:MAG: type II secretion system F family protein [Candidatus Altiarchaeota archaeon]|nr:type II secretion system F family protein [Candidatus Altiarchaeota archaeon]
MIKLRDALSRIVPHRLRVDLDQMLAYSGIRFNVDKFFSTTIGTSLFISAVIGLILIETNQLPFVMTFAVAEAIQVIAVYAYLIVSADKRGRFVESVLPDVLKLTASNLKSGLTIDRALLHSARPEFGFFREEIKLVASNMMAGDTFENALKEMNRRVKSNDFTAAVELITQGIRSGGRLADSVDSMADILMNREMVKKEIRTGVQMYTSLVIFAIVGGAPILFGISTFLIEILKSMSARITGATGDTMALATKAASAGVFTPSTIPIEVEFIKHFALISLTTTSVIGSIVVSLISTGNWKRGLKNIPVFCFLSTAIFLIVNEVLHNVIGTQFL